MAGLTIAERRELKARAQVRAAMVEAWHGDAKSGEEPRPFSILDKHLPRLNVGMGTWRKRQHPLHSFG